MVSRTGFVVLMLVSYQSIQGLSPVLQLDFYRSALIRMKRACAERKYQPKKFLYIFQRLSVLLSYLLSKYVIN